LFNFAKKTVAMEIKITIENNLSYKGELNMKSMVISKLKLISYAFFAFALYACAKSDETPSTAIRGKLNSQAQTGLSIYVKEQIVAAFQLLSPAAAQSIKPEYDVVLYKINYQTIDAFGNPTKASGLVAIPQKASKALPIASFHHGTVLKKTDVPSQLGTGYQVGLAFGTEGYVTAMPDFLGLGEGAGLHPYMHAKTEATACIDMIRATKELCKNLNITLNNQLFLFGYSQGGHVTLAVQKEIEAKHAAELPITASSPMAAPTDLSGLQMDSLLKPTPYVAPSYLPYIMFSQNPIYKMYADLNNVFVSPYNTSLAPFFVESMPFSSAELEAILPSSKIPTAILKPDELQKIVSNRQTHPTVLALKDSDLFDWKPVAPLKFCHCDADRHVYYENAVKAKTFFERNGASNIEIINPLRGGDHNTCLLPSIVWAKGWFNSLKK
jgi:hypothetical protein